MTNKKVYLAHSISTKGEYEDSKRVANEIRALGFDVYAAAENDSINDKTNDPTPIDIYNGDVNEIVDCDVFVVNLSDGHGTISEIGLVAGINEEREANGETSIDIVGYTSNARLLRPQQYEGMASASANHLVLGMINRWGRFVGDEQSMLDELLFMAEMREEEEQSFGYAVDEFIKALVAETVKHIKGAIK